MTPCLPLPVPASVFRVDYRHALAFFRPGNPPVNAAARQRWIIGPVTDVSVFIATPLAIVPAFHLLMNVFSLGLLKLGVMAVSATGHHLPGLIRAYTDRAIFRQFRLRLILVPSLIILLTLVSAYFKLTVALCALIFWSIWHGSMQIFGFLRIYDLKAGFASALTARLDFWMCLAWFIQVVLWSPARKMSFLSSFYMAGGPLVSVSWARVFEMAWLAFTLAVTAAFSANLLHAWFRRKYLNLPKLLTLASSIGFWAYCMILSPNLIIGLILWEIFHDLQYNVFVWNYNRNRVARNLSQSAIERFLFQADWKRIAFYAACIAAYGSIGLLSRDLVNLYENGPTYTNLLFQIGNVFAASGLIHFYLDGFIWKVRDGKVQQDLGINASGGFRNRPRAVHGALVTAFLAVCAVLGISEYHHLNVSDRQSQIDNLADLVPKSGYANFMKASHLKSAGRADSAIVYYERAMRHDTTYRFGHAFIADLKYQAGDLVGALAHYEKAIELDPESDLIRGNLAGLYLQTGALARAEEQYRVLLARDARNPENQFQMAWTLLRMKKGLQAKPYLEETLRLDPAQPRALNYLGMVEQALGNRERAMELFRKSLELDSTYVQARENLVAIKP